MIGKATYQNIKNGGLEKEENQFSQVIEGKFATYWLIMLLNLGLGESIAYCTNGTNVIDIFALDKNQQYLSFSGARLTQDTSN